MAHDVAAPLVDYIRSQLIDEDKSSAPALTVMVGHDSNIASLLASLKVKPYQLPDQYEQTPIGGQLVFERWHDKKTDKDLLKIEYVYQSTEQLHNAEPLSLSNPPKRVTLELSGCPTDGNGYCSWQDFTHVMDDALQGTAMQPHMAVDDSSSAAASTAENVSAPASATPSAKTADNSDSPSTAAASTQPKSAAQSAPSQEKRAEKSSASATAHDSDHASGQGNSSGGESHGEKR